MGIALLFTKYYFLFLIITSVFLSAGFITYRLLPVRKDPSGNYTVLFYSMLLGLILCVTVFSLIRTAGHSVNILFLITAVLLLYRYYSKKDFETEGLLKYLWLFLKKNFPLLIISTLIFFSYEAVWFLKSGTFHFVIPFVDYVDMYNISQVITQTGQENNKYLLSNYYYEAFHGISPYHYFELWLNGFFSTVLPVPGIATLMLFVYPLFYVTSYFGLLAIWEHYGKVTCFKAALSFVILFTGGMYFEFYNRYELLKWYGGLVGNIAHVWGKKSAVLYPFVIASFLFFIKGKNVPATFLLLCTSIVTIGVMPGISGGIFLFLLLNKWHKTYTREDIKFLYLLFFIFFIAFVGIYVLWGNKNAESLGFGQIISDFFSAFDTSLLKTLFFRMFFSELRLLIIFSPYLLFIVIVLFKRSNITYEKIKVFRNILILLLLIFAIGSITGTIASINLFSGGQFFTYLIPLLIIYIMLVFTAWQSNITLSKNSRIVYINVLIFLFFVGCAIYNITNNIRLQGHYKEQSLNLYSETYLKDITTYLNSHELNPLGVCFMGNEDIKNYPLNAYGLTGLTFSGMSIKLTNQFNAVSNLSIFDLDIDTNTSFNKSLFKSFEFYNFIKQQKATNSYISTDQSKSDFINEHSIDYALVYRDGLLPEALKERVATSYFDSISGQSFIVFNK
ncbi:MAG: hypothetical protein BWY70_00778 [Bacteroidetes bacterium ADurb.Bin408]|nr:MAG: hypothetical protein BWY70_00778 [Bacteroidetes bacterium ADurb.Bin408]